MNKNNVFKTRLAGKGTLFYTRDRRVGVVKEISEPDVLVLLVVERKTER